MGVGGNDEDRTTEDVFRVTEMGDTLKGETREWSSEIFQ